MVELITNLLQRGISQQVIIQAIGVWDTVGALGVPTFPLLKAIGLPDFLKEYKFFDTDIDDHIRHAFQALALDEKRAPYAPTLWEKKSGVDTRLKQVWFPGVHSNVGGSYADTGIADITLAWMMSQLSPWIDFTPGYMKEQRRLHEDYYANLKPAESRGWALGKVYNSATFPTVLAGTAHRTPLLYYGTNYLTGRKNSEPLRNTNEHIHASVRMRIEMEGKGTNDKGSYYPAGLVDWELQDGSEFSDTPKTSRSANSSTDQLHHSHHAPATPVSAEDLHKKICWVYRGKNPAGYHDPETKKNPKVMYEDKLGKFELELLNLDPVARQKVGVTAGVAKAKSIPWGNWNPMRSW